MRTLGRRHTKRKPGGDYRSACDECRAPELRSKLIRRADGKLYHRQGDCQPSRVDIELSRGNAEKAGARRTYPPADGAGYADRGQPFATLGQPTNPMVGWAWVNWVDGTKRDGSAGVAVTKLAAGDFQVLLNGATFREAQLFHFEPQFGGAAVLPLFLVAGMAGAGAAKLKVRNRFETTGGIDSQSFLLLLYDDRGAPNMMTQVGWAWVKGSDGTLYDSSGNVTSSRTSAGIYSASLTGVTYKIAAASQQCQGDPSLVTPVLIGAGQISGSVAGVICQDRVGTLTDADFVVRFLA